jgi:uncharacterized protein (TIGR03067 family)
MIHRILLALGLASILIQFGYADDSSKDQEKLQGEWHVASMRVQGQDIDVAKLGEGAYVFTKNRLKVTGAQESVAEVTLRPDSKPKELDLKSIEGVGAGRTVFGLYRFDGDKLVLCIGDIRPKEFSGEGAAGLLILERRKKSE